MSDKDIFLLGVLSLSDTHYKITFTSFVFSTYEVAVVAWVDNCKRAIAI